VLKLKVSTGNSNTGNTMTDLILSDRLFATGEIYVQYGRPTKTVRLGLTRNSVRPTKKINNSEGFLTSIKMFMSPVDSKGRTMVIRLCDCGNEYVARVENLKAGLSLTCPDNNRHPLIHKHELYTVWAGAVSRCSNPNYHAYHRYGGRGIKVCDRWWPKDDKSGGGFKAFLEDMGERPKGGYELDRIDADGDYEPGNCQWLLKDKNLKKKNSTIRFDIEGEVKLISDVAKEVGLAHATLRARLQVYNWPFHKATNNFYKDKLVFQVGGKFNILMEP
jgi:hypothetical protein